MGLVAILLAAICAVLAADILMEHLEKTRFKSDVTARIGSVPNAGGRSSRASRPLSRHPKSKKMSDTQIERDLVELIDVLGLGMGAGMSFENAFLVYTERFDTELASRCRSTALVMANGVVSREEAMSALADELDSRSFCRFVRITLRSVRYGSGLLPMLEGLRKDIRRSYRNGIEERISKAATKMLVPTGVLILPAMLLLVTGPFLLEFAGQI